MVSEQAELPKAPVAVENREPFAVVTRRLHAQRRRRDRVRAENVSAQVMRRVDTRG